MECLKRKQQLGGQSFVPWQEIKFFQKVALGWPFTLNVSGWLYWTEVNLFWEYSFCYKAPYCNAFSWGNFLLLLLFQKVSLDLVFLSTFWTSSSSPSYMYGHCTILIYQASNSHPNNIITVARGSFTWSVTEHDQGTLILTLTAPAR